MSAADLSVLQRPHDRLRRRRVVNRGMELLAWLAAALAVLILGIVIFSVARRGASALNLDLLTKSQLQFAPPNVKQGLANAFVGTLIIVGLATLMALPFGILIAIYVNEFASKAIRSAVTLTLDVLAGVPAIVIGFFVYGLIVVGHGQSGYAGAFALAVLMLPLVARSTIEVLVLVPDSLREAALGRRRAALEDDARGRAAPDDRRRAHGGDAGGRARRGGDCAAAARVLARGEQGSTGTRPSRSDRSPRDLRARRLARSGRPCARLGGCARADPVHPRREPHSAMARHS